MLKKLQKTHRAWSDKNFGDRVPVLPEKAKLRALNLADHVGCIAHAILKTDQGIRGSAKEHQQKLDFSLHSLRNLVMNQFSVMPTNERRFREPAMQNAEKNAREALKVQCCLGVIEETGELASAMLRGDRDDVKDAIGDVFLYLLDLCNKMDFDMHDLIEEVAGKVHGRDWNHNPNNDLPAFRNEYLQSPPDSDFIKFLRATDAYSATARAPQPNKKSKTIFQMRSPAVDFGDRKLFNVMTLQNTIMPEPMLECPSCEGRGWYAYTEDRRPRQEYEEPEKIQDPCEICEGSGDLGISAKDGALIASTEDPTGQAEYLGYSKLAAAFRAGYQSVLE